jgi:hypothetical protein
MCRSGEFYFPERKLMIFPCREETHNPSTRVEGRKRTEDVELCKKELESI